MQENVMYKYRFPITVALVIYLMSAISQPPGEVTITFTSSLYHFGIYFIFQWSLLRSGVGKKALPFAIAYGVLDEFHQSFVPGRVCTMEDMIINSIGIATAAVVFWLFKLANDE